MDFQQSIRKILLEEAKGQKVLVLPGLSFFGENPQDAWNNMQKLLKLKGYPPYSVRGDLNLMNAKIQSLGNLVSVGGDLDLSGTELKSLGNLEFVGGYLNLKRTKIKSSGNLQSVDGNLYLDETPIESLENLQFVGGNWDLRYTPLSKMYTEKQIREMVIVGGKIYL